MSIQLSPAEASALTSFGAFRSTDVIPPALNDDVTFAGFPGMTTQPISAASVRSCVSKVKGISIALDSPALPGYSGGPLYTDNGLLGIMHGDIGIKPNFTNGLAISLDAVREFLFL